MTLMSPDCRDGKHSSCTGMGWETELDCPMDCPCPCHRGAS